LKSAGTPGAVVCAPRRASGPSGPDLQGARYNTAMDDPRPASPKPTCRECPLVRPPYPPAILARSRELLAGIVALLAPYPAGRLAARLVLRRYPRYAREAEGAARALGVAPPEVMLATISYDLFAGSVGCSTMALAGREGPVLARNMDWMLPDLIARASCVTEVPGGLSAGFAGSVGVISGLSGRGFAVVLNAVAGGGLNESGEPVLLFLRRLVDEAGSFDEAVELASSAPLAAPALLTLAGTENRQRVCVERSPSECRQRRAEGDAPLLVTNHFRRLCRAEPCPRYEHLADHAPRLGPSPADEDLLALLTHPCVRQDITAQHVVARPAEGTLRMFVQAALLGDGAGAVP
jgi:hypothetical protein